MVPRTGARALRKLAGYFPVVGITGPRQSGKTTLARGTFPAKPHVSLEDPDVREFASRDPRGFLRQYPEGAVVDEAQRCPDLFSYIQTRVDEDRRPGMFVLTGSQQFGLLAGITQSLAGRIGLFHLLPFALEELSAARLLQRKIEDLLWTGCYPAIYDKGIPPAMWASQYVATYIERDVRQLINVRDLGTFQKFTRMCAARTAQLLNLSSLASDCGITHNTARAWLSVLEASYIVFLLHPHYRNLGRRLVKTPKLFFYDSGLAAWLAGVHEPSQIAIHSMRGALFETWVVSELLKFRHNRGLAANLFFWRDSSGNEVDVVVETGEDLIPIEIKAGETVASDYFGGLDRWCAFADRDSQGFVVYAGEAAQRRHGIRVVPWRQLDTISRAILA